MPDDEADEYAGLPIRRQRDPEIDRAKRRIREIIEQDPRRIFYIKQIQVLLEKWHFHWITGFALSELIAEGVLAVEEVEVTHAKVRFIHHPQHRRRRRQIKRALAVINRYWRPEISHACGDQAEILFLVALMENRFELFGRNTREHRGRRWVESQQNLDFVVGRDGVEYGVEVKNTWDYIPHDELEAKLRICRFLGVRPLFIMRHAAKSYIHEIAEEGGYGMIFEAHIFPKGQEGLVEDIKRGVRDAM